MSSHRKPVRPRYGRITALGTAVVVTLISGLAGLGILTDGPTAAAHQLVRPTSYDQKQSSDTQADATPPQGTKTRTTTDTTTDSRSNASSTDDGTADSPDLSAVPDASGQGRRIVFSQHLQRVWLLGDADKVLRTYLVSGSVTHNLVPGTYAVYSKSRWAVGIDDSGVMQYFVRFTQGPTGAAIGFHTIPTKDGVPLQGKAQLGTPESHGCIRQATPNAIALWNFAPIGTKVVVVA
jgi:hypothetical protein